MALKKKKKYKNGTSAEYHRIERIIVEPYTEVILEANEPIPGRKKDEVDDRPLQQKTSKGYKISAILASYTSEEVRRQDSSLLLGETIIVKKVEEKDFNSSNLFPQIYDYIKHTEDFNDAKDV